MVEKGKIQADPRHTARSMRSAIQGNVIKTLVELITNSNDSYTRLEGRGSPKNGVIEICYSKNGFVGYFSVRDYAEGMSYDEIKEKFTSYGKATSGLMEGHKVRGYFGQGAKDALASMIDGEIRTIKDGIYTVCRIYIQNNEPWYEIEAPENASQEIRHESGIPENGTLATFNADPEKGFTVPQFATVQSELANNYQLRNILMNKSRRIWLFVEKEKNPRLLAFKTPPGKEINQSNFDIEFGDYGKVPICLQVFRSNEELTQTGDDRLGGILISDDANNVLGISLFKFENEPLASHLFGELKIGRFGELLKNEEPVLKDERDREGLMPNHPFNRELIEKTEAILQSVIDEEKARKQQEVETQIDSAERERYRKAFEILNEIAEDEVKEVQNLGDSTTNFEELPPDGLGLYPSSAIISVGKKYSLRLRIDPSQFNQDSIVKIHASNKALKLITKRIDLHDSGHNIIEKFITFEAIEPDRTTIIKAEIEKKTTQAEIVTVPEKEFVFSGGMVFTPESVTLHPNRPRIISLAINSLTIPGGSEITVRSDNPSIHVSTDTIIVNKALAEKNLQRTDFDIWGNSIGEEGVVTAKYKNKFHATLKVAVRAIQEEPKTAYKGFFNDFELNYFEKEPLQRVSYSKETGKIIIYADFPSTRHYIGTNGEYIKTLAAQVLIADLVAETCFREIAKRKVETSGEALSPEAVPELITREANDLSRKFGKQLHDVLVNQSLLNNEKMAMKNHK